MSVIGDKRVGLGVTISSMTNTTRDVTVRRAILNDAQELAALGAATFTETFGHLYPPEDLQTFLVETHSVDAWSRVLADSKRAVWLAMLDTSPIGFITVGACKLPIENREPTAGEIQQLYVLATHHNLQIGSRLMDLGLDWLDAQGQTPQYVGVWSENIGGQRFYSRYGFQKVGEYGFRVGSTVDHEFILKR
jgi:ribosomal protein S18 acetylase RimI-like enzyme